MSISAYAQWQKCDGKFKPGEQKRLKIFFEPLTQAAEKKNPRFSNRSRTFMTSSLQSPVVDTANLGPVWAKNQQAQQFYFVDRAKWHWHRSQLQVEWWFACGIYQLQP